MEFFGTGVPPAATPAAFALMRCILRLRLLKTAGLQGDSNHQQQQQRTTTGQVVVSH
jgi:hypothetical protein